MKKLFKLGLLIGGATLVGKLLAAKKAEWKGMTESEVRTKLDAKLSDRVPADKKTEIADKVVSVMRDKGVLGEDTATTSDTAEAAGL